MLAIYLGSIFLAITAIVYVYFRKAARPGDGGIAPMATIDRQIARFEQDLAEATTQEERDTAEGRLRYWTREKHRA